MNTNSINTISKYLLLFLLILTGASCNDNDDAEDTSIPVLISQNINDGDVVGPSGYVELTFSKAMRQAPDTEIYFNGGVVRVSINYEKVRYTFSGMENGSSSNLVVISFLFQLSSSFLILLKVVDMFAF